MTNPKFKKGQFIMVRDRKGTPWLPRRFSLLSPIGKYVCQDNHLLNQKFMWKYARKLTLEERGE